MPSSSHPPRLSRSGMPPPRRGRDEPGGYDVAGPQVGARPGEAVVVTADPVLAERIVRGAAEVGVHARVVAAPSAAASGWADGALVLLGADCVPHLPPRTAKPPGGLVVVLDEEGELPVDLLPGAASQRAGVPSTGRAGRAAAGAWVAGLPPGLADAELVVLPSGRRRLLEHLASVLPVAGAPVLGVVGGRGGAGASALAVSAALSAAGTGLRVALLDLDPLGGGVDLLLGADRQEGLRWSDLGAVPGPLPHGALWASLPEAAGVGYLTWSRDDGAAVPAAPAGPPGAPAVLPAVLEAARREADLVVLDLPRCPHVLAAAAGPASRVVVVVPAEVRAAASARRVVAVLEPAAPDLGLVVRGPAPTGLPAEAVAEVLGVPLVGELRPEPGLAEALDRGDPPITRPRGPLALLCRRLVAELVPATALR